MAEQLLQAAQAIGRRANRWTTAGYLLNLLPKVSYESSNRNTNKKSNTCPHQSSLHDTHRGIHGNTHAGAH
jgi:hypothetical protein